MTDVPALRAAVPVAAPTPVSMSAGNATAALAMVTGGALPAAVAQLGVGAMIAGTVVAGAGGERGPRGQVVIQTDKGAITLQTPLALPVGAKVTLQLQSLGAQSQLMILSVDGQPLSSQALAAQFAGQQIPGQPAAPGKPGALPLPTLGSHSDAAQSGSAPRAPATTLSGAAATAAPTVAALQSAAPAAFRPGLVVTGHIVAPAVTPLTAAAPTAAALPTATSAPSAAALADHGDALPLRILGVAAMPPRSAGLAPLPEQALPRALAEIPAADDAITFAATVAEASPEDAAQATLLRSPFGTVRLPVPANLPPGSQLLVELLAPRGEAPLARLDHVAADLGASRRLIALGQEWPALRDVLGALQSADPVVAQATVNAAMPRVGPTLAAGLLFFIGAARSGSLRNWMGDQAIETLERAGHGPLAARLADDVANLPRLAETQPNGWQTLLLPVFDGDRLRQIRMSLRRGSKGEDGKGKEGARFIIEAELSKLGPLQLDGLVRLPQFDLAVRTRDNLSPDIRANIVEIFNDAMQATKFAGSVTFQVAREMKAGPFENWQAAGLGVTV